MFNNKTKLKEIEPAGKRVILRCDFNVPILKDKILSDSRIRLSLPSIQYLIKKKAKIILITHLGQPKGIFTESLQLKIIYQYLKTILPISFEEADFRLEKAKKSIHNIQNGHILLLENIRFYPEEEQGEYDERQRVFCEQLTDQVDFYVNEAFSVSHRRHASIVQLPKFVNKSAMGFLFAREINYLHDQLVQPKRPFVAIIGGAKISSKIRLLTHLLPKVDQLLLGGAMVFTFLAALDYSIGRSPIEENYLVEARQLYNKYKDRIILPLDFLTSTEFSFPYIGAIRKCSFESIPPSYFCVDIGEKTCALFQKYISQAQLILWNGPMGIFENSKSAHGTHAIATMLAQCERKILTIVGGGDSVTALERTGLANKVSHISTGGGATLDLLAHGYLPGHQVLSKSSQKKYIPTR